MLVAKDGRMKLADFGASKRLGHDSVMSGLKGTPHWMAPEIIKGLQTGQVRVRPFEPNPNPSLNPEPSLPTQRSVSATSYR